MKIQAIMLLVLAFNLGTAQAGEQRKTIKREQPKTVLPAQPQHQPTAYMACVTTGSNIGTAGANYSCNPECGAGKSCHKIED